VTDESETADGPVSVDVQIEEGRTTIAITGEREAAVVVRSSSGEQIYLPPERETQSTGADSSYETGTGEASPYQSSENGETPYEGAPSDSPYRSPPQQSVEPGLTPTANGIRIVHPEPVTDLRLLR